MTRRIDIASPAGMVAAQDPRQLPANVAQLAINTRLWNKTLACFRGLTQIATLAKTGVKRSIYRFGRDRSDDTQWWMHWTTDVDVVRSPVASTTNERTYFTGDGAPKVTDATMINAGGGAQYPAQSKPVGVPAPTATPAVAVSGSAGAGETPSTLYVVYTFVNEWGEEGPPSPVSWAFEAAASQTLTLTNLEVPTGAWSYTIKRIYLSAGSGSSASFYLVKEIAASLTTTTMNANVPAFSIGGIVAGSGIGAQLLTTFFDPPPATLHSLKLLNTQILVGLDGMSLRWCEPGYPYAWPADNAIHFEDMPIGMGVFDGTIVVCTERIPYLIQGTPPSDVRPMEGFPACVSKRSIVAVTTDTGHGVAYASPMGMHLVTAGAIQNMVAGYFSPDQWAALNPASMQAVYWLGIVVVSYDAGSVHRLLLLQNGVEPVIIDLGVTVTAMYVEPRNNRLYVVANGAVHQFDAGSALTARWRSKRFVLERPMNFGAVRLHGNNPAATLRIFAEQLVSGVPTMVQVVSQQITSAKPTPLPAGYLADVIEVEVEGVGIDCFPLTLGRTIKDVSREAG